MHPKVWLHWPRHAFHLNSALSSPVFLGSHCAVQTSHRVAVRRVTGAGTLYKRPFSRWGNPFRLKGRMKGLSSGSLVLGFSGTVPLKELVPFLQGKY